MFLLISYHSSFKSTSSQFGATAKLADMLARKPIVSKLIRADYFSQIDDVTLNTLKGEVEKEFKKLDAFEYMQDICEKTVGEWRSIIPAEDIKLLKALGVKKPFSSSTKNSSEVGLKNVFISKRFYRKMIEHLMEDIDAEIKSREKEIEKFAPERIPDRPKGQRNQGSTEPVVGKRHSVDDSVLIPFRKKLSSYEAAEAAETSEDSKTSETSKSSKTSKSKSLSKKSFVERFKDELLDCKNLDSIEELLLTYTTSTGCDLMNGFLRGDLTTIKSKKLALNPSYGTNLNVSFNLLLDIVAKSLKLKKELMRGTIDEDITLYRGLSLDKFMKYTGIPKNVKENVGGNYAEYYGEVVSPSKAVAEYITNYSGGYLCYKSPEMTSTSLDSFAAGQHSRKFKSGEQVFMEINVKKGTAFGKDFSKTSFGSDDSNYEVLLMPNQKIRILKAFPLQTTLRVECETVL